MSSHVDELLKDVVTEIRALDKKFSAQVARPFGPLNTTEKLVKFLRAVHDQRHPLLYLAIEQVSKSERPREKSPRNYFTILEKYGLKLDWRKEMTGGNYTGRV